jgi:L-alanine-DL-glutamate epimerase-like enolase superfamily enzyme
VASLEFAILDLLGKISGLPVGDLVGEVRRDKIAVYRANNYRSKTAEESVELIMKNVEKTGARAIKYKIGGRMSNDRDSLPGRTEKLITLARKTLSDEITIYADANGSYNPPEAIRIGHLLEETNVSFFEEPCPFDYYEETKTVADALTIPIAGGEQESSLQRFRWLIGSGCLQVVQPDLFYFGGMIRAIKVARMAEAAGLPCTPHISGGGMGHLYMLHFASCIKDPGPYQEFKGSTDIPFQCDSSSLKSEQGLVTVPSGSGWGISLDPDFISQAEVIHI